MSEVGGNNDVGDQKSSPYVPKINTNESDDSCEGRMTVLNSKKEIKLI